MAIERELQIFRDYVRRNGLRMTATRLALFDEIFTRHEHIDADRLYEEMRRKGRKISRASVYRNLDLLAACGLVRRYRLDQSRNLYEHIHAGLQHDHLVCRECGRLVEFVSPGIRALQRELCQAHGFDPADTSVQVVGRCITCKRAREAAGGPSS